ncbi:UDP-2,3-diacylglucosamine diphosphatase [Methylococcus sp. EFPC2]|uniref:UDP-2,3-diacylglucosamine diphosphatase n=1 Tax=Methylococcus sp. EFPC2 TaxID=2812648 RepID=UPI0019687A51|nr:UDP-2,3-diacylglucosamine diphosphatase [Methylococcus sp. EFPC2]QSA98745.1 UDP-2,3-diacylglucosamine diphosphatase [Methylococcus sp. EFPC2]
MKPETLFISDLHLSAARPDITRRFLGFIQQRALGVERLYILGDLFDAYIGDDDNAPPNRQIKLALRKVSDRGTAVFFQHGNRDFLLGEDFCRETGATLLGDYAVIDLYGVPALVTHGDLLCTDDIPYQEARLRVRSEQWKSDALSKPLWLRQVYARWYRFKSGLDKSKKTQEIMDANPQTVEAVLQHHGVRTLIHGHTHRPALHRFELDGQPARRFVLAEWNPDGQVLCWHKDGSWGLENIV